MGITVSELLSTEFFRDFRVIAGHRGLNREIQGVTFIEAPDSHHWAIGKELVFTSGYVFVQNPDYIKTLERVEHPGHSALVIKRERYLDKVPEELIALYERSYKMFARLL